jgi:hypothetical protein
MIKFTDNEYEIIDDIIFECVFDYPDEIKIINNNICLCYGCTINYSVDKCNNNIYNEVIICSEILLKRCELLINLEEFIFNNIINKF